MRFKLTIEHSTGPAEIEAEVFVDISAKDLGQISPEMIAAAADLLKAHMVVCLTDRAMDLKRRAGLA